MEGYVKVRAGMLENLIKDAEILNERLIEIAQKNGIDSWTLLEAGYPQFMGAVRALEVYLEGGELYRPVEQSA